ncbi:MAG: type II secretion system protein GspE, partial [Clostridiales bacterium]|nr:type II secretion system protein GspE [Clostridiales bacterium]
RCIISQRLVRRLCDDCKIGYEAEGSNLINIPEKSKIFKPGGCKKCDFSGYKGRFAVYEILYTDEVLINMIDNKASSGQIRQYLIQNNFQFINNCLRKHILMGTTSVEEMLKVVYLNI